MSKTSVSLTPYLKLELGAFYTITSVTDKRTDKQTFGLLLKSKMPQKGGPKVIGCGQ